MGCHGQQFFNGRQLYVYTLYHNNFTLNINYVNKSVLYGTAQLQFNECSRVACKFHVYHLCVSRVSLVCITRVTCVYLTCHSHVMNLRVRSTTVYFYSSFSLQVTSELANSRSKQTTVLG